MCRMGKRRVEVWDRERRPGAVLGHNLLLGCLLVTVIVNSMVGGVAETPYLPCEVLGLGMVRQVKLGPVGLLGTCSDTAVHLWFLNGTLFSTLPARNGMPWSSFDWSPDGSLIAAADYRGRITVAPVANLSGVVLEIAHDFGHQYGTGGGSLPTWPLEWSPDGSMLAFGYGDQTYVFNSTSGRLQTRLDEPSGTNEPGFLDWSRDGGRLVKSDVGATLIYDTETWEVLLRIPSDRMDPSAFSPNGSAVAILQTRWIPINESMSEEEYSLSIYDASMGGLLTSMPLDKQPRCIAWSPCGGMLAVACGRDLLIIPSRDESMATNLSDVHGGQSRIQSLSWMGSVLVSASEDQVVDIWSVDTASTPPCFTLTLTLRGWASSVVGVEWFPDNQQLLTLDDTRDLPIVHRLGETQEPGPFCLEKTDWSGLSPDGSILATIGGMEVALWDALYGSLATRIYPAFRPSFCRWNPRDPDLLAIAGENRVEVWDLAMARDANPVAGLDIPGTIRGLEWSPQQGNLLAIAWTSRDGSVVEVWDPSRKTVLSSSPTWHYLYSLAWSPDGSYLACLAGYDYEAVYDKENPPPDLCRLHGTSPVLV